ncbi:lipo-like protein [Pokkaliibacter sp. CJK22405]|uniref:lipo-like protein n=1 Tax=Pokkaliibacter sp. CJK22405 TaxID=3384615 RepID=UPI0039853D06
MLRFIYQVSGAAFTVQEAVMGIAAVFGQKLASYLARPRYAESSRSTFDIEKLRSVIKPGDVLLVEGTSRISTTIKYLTQSTWSHAAFYLGSFTSYEIRTLGIAYQIKENWPTEQESFSLLVEADILEGVRVVPLEEYRGLHTRICRPVGLMKRDLEQLRHFFLARIGHQYDLKNIVDLIRYLVIPPIPTPWRRAFLRLGSGDPTQAICSSLIAQGFQAIQYPVLPRVSWIAWQDAKGVERREEILHKRDASQYVPRDFDVSPYFQVVKPSIEAGFDLRDLHWARSEQNDQAVVEQVEEGW